MHGASLAPDAPGLPPGELGQDPEHRDAHHVREPVGAVGGDDSVLERENVGGKTIVDGCRKNSIFKNIFGGMRTLLNDFKSPLLPAKD